MAKKQVFTEDTLRAMGLQRNTDGSYSKAKSVQQPREVLSLKKRQNISYGAIELVVKESYKTFEKDHIDAIKPNEEFRRISLVLLGEPMPKQSVRSTKTGHHFQPKKHVDRAKDYKRQIANQLPTDFIPFSQEVHITKYHFVYAPLKAFQKQKGVMEKIRNGEMVMKLTAGDLDNLLKPVNDSMNDLVFKDDAIVHSIDGLKKYYGIGGCVIIEMIGK